MITTKEAIAIGHQIVLACQRECERATDPNQRFAARGVALNSIQNLWYDVLPLKVRESIGSIAAFHVDCGWE